MSAYIVRKAVVTAAGLGTRLLPATKEQPKEMLSVFVRGANGQCCLKPLLQCIFEQLHDVGFREFCFVTGRGKRMMEDHFTQDQTYVEFLKSKGSLSQALDLESFYRKLDDSTIMWVNQSEARGFGDAVLKSQSIIGNERFLVSAGDVYIASPRESHIRRLIEISSTIEAEAMFLAQEVEDPGRHGIIEIEKVHDDVYKVKRAVEKPKDPLAKVAIVPIYVFQPIVFKALGQLKPGVQGEIQLTDAIQGLIDWDLRVYAIRLKAEDVRLDIGTPEAYRHALKVSHDKCSA